MAVASRQIVKLVDGRAFLVSEEILKHMSAVDLINGLMEKGEKFTAAKVDFSKKSQTSLRVIGNDAFLVKEKIERDLDLVEFVSKIDLTNHPFDSGLLPANTIQCVGSDTIKVVVVELEPAVRPILYAGYQYGEKKGDRLTRTGGRRFNISLPYLYTFWKFQIVDSGLSFSGMHVFATPEPISGEKDILYECPLPNIFGGGGLLSWNDGHKWVRYKSAREDRQVSESVAVSTVQRRPFA